MEEDTGRARKRWNRERQGGESRGRGRKDQGEQREAGRERQRTPAPLITLRGREPLHPFDEAANVLLSL